MFPVGTVPWLEENNTFRHRIMSLGGKHSWVMFTEKPNRKRNYSPRPARTMFSALHMKHNKKQKRQTCTIKAERHTSFVAVVGRQKSLRVFRLAQKVDLKSSGSPSSPLGLHRKNQKLPRRFPWFLKIGPTARDQTKKWFDDLLVYFIPCATFPMFMLMQNAQNERTVTPPTLQFWSFCCRVSRVVLESASPSRLTKKINIKKTTRPSFFKSFLKIAKND